MDVAAVMTRVKERLSTIDGLRVYDYEPDDVQPPAAVVLEPSTVEYDATMSRGSDRIEVRVRVVVSVVVDRTWLTLMAPYANGAGSSSIKAALEVAAPSEGSAVFDYLTVQRCEFLDVTWGGTPYRAADFTCEIVGSGD